MGDIGTVIKIRRIETPELAPTIYPPLVLPELAPVPERELIPVGPRR